MTLQSTRSGFDEALTWRIRTSDDATAQALLRSVEALDEDEMLFIASMPPDWTPEVAEAAGVVTSYSILDLAHLVAGPKQRARAAQRHSVYRAVFVS